MDNPFAHPLMQQWRSHIAVKLLIEPGNEPADFSAIGRGSTDKGNLVADFLDIFADRHRIRQVQTTRLILHHRRTSRRIDMQKFIAVIPRIFAFKAVGNSFFA